MQIVAIITEKKLILSFRDITDVDVYLEQQETVSAVGPWALPSVAINYPTLSSFWKTRIFSQVCRMEMYLVWVIAKGDLVVANPDIGHIVVNVAHPYL